MTVVSIHRTRNGVLTSADSATLSIVNAVGSVALPPTPVIPESEGVYVYTTSSLPAGRYTATWVFTVAGLGTDTVARAFQVDTSIELSEGIMLMELERLVARKIGPYRRLRTGMGSTPDKIYAPRIKSSLALGSYEDQYVLRRGTTWGDELVTGFNQNDRTRLVSEYDSVIGTLALDRDYATAPLDGEAVELHVLDPEDELRPAVIDALGRCYFWDTLSITVTGSGVYNIDLTASAPWLTNPTHIRDVSLSYPSQILPPTRMNWWEPYREGKSLKMYTKGGAVGSVTLLVLRPVKTLVNGEISLSGPNDDFDVIYGDPDYLSWAGVLKCWENHAELLTPLATQALRPSRTDAANEFTKKSMAIATQVPDRRQIDYGVPDLVQIGNLAEPVT